MREITPSVLHALLRLDPETGRLYWRERGVEWFKDTPGRTAAGARAIWNAQNAGREAFLKRHPRGYVCGVIFNRRYLAHRVVFAMTHGYWPEGDVDHINGIRTDNRPVNLREATRAQNNRNISRHRDGSSAFKGVSWAGHAGRWVAQGKDASSRRRHLGYFADEIAAARAYDAFARREHGDFARLNFPEGETA